MKVDELMGSARDLLTVKKVYGEPYEKASFHTDHGQTEAWARRCAAL